MIDIEFLEESFLDIDRAFMLLSVMECKIIEEVLEVA